MPEACSILQKSVNNILSGFSLFAIHLQNGQPVSLVLFGGEQKDNQLQF